MVSLINWFTPVDERDKTLKRIRWFNKWFKPDIFEDIDKLVAWYIEFCGNVSVTVNDKSLDLFLDMELPSKLVKSRFNFKDNSICPRIDYNELKPLDASYPTIKNSVKFAIDNMIKVPRGESFRLDVTLALTKEREQKIKLEFLSTAQALSINFDNKNVDQSKFRLAEIERVYGGDCLNDLSYIEGDVVESEYEENKKIFETGFSTLDTDLYGGITTGNIYAVAAAPKAGKTSILCNLAYKAIVSGVNVYFDSLEMRVREIENKLVALHCFYAYKMVVPDSLMKTDLLTEEQRTIMNIAREDLLPNDEESRKERGYGKLIVSHDTTLSTLRDSLVEKIEIYDIKLYCLDYAGFISTGNNQEYKKLADYEKIKEVYRTLHSIQASHSIAMVVANQLNKEGIEASKKKEPINSSHIEGGQEVTRTSDYVMALLVDDKSKATTRRFQLVATRISPGFADFYVKCNLGYSDFNELKRVEEGE